MRFGEFLKKQREAKGFTQPEAAEQIGIEQSYLSKLENNKALPSPEIFDRIIGAYNFDIKTLGEQLNDSELDRLSEIVLIRDFVMTTRKRTEGTRRKWLIAGLIMLTAGAGLFAHGVLSRDNLNVSYIYESKGVIKPGEQAYIFLEMPSYYRFSSFMERLEAPREENSTSQEANSSRQPKQLSMKEMLMQHPLFPRLDYKQIAYPYFNGNFFDKETGDGFRRYQLIETNEHAESSPHYLSITLGSMLFVGSLGVFFVSRRW